MVSQQDSIGTSIPTTPGQSQSFTIPIEDRYADLTLERNYDLSKGGVKYDAGKRRFSLVPFDALGGVVDVLGFGAKKYADRNWETGMDWDRVFDATLRHLQNWWHRVDRGKGPGRDEDSGYSDLWHAGCCIMFLIAYEMRGVGKDNRP